jgi:RNA polymerase sigma-70 factor (ECF subfamily)
VSADALLIDQIRSGDEAAWNELIARFEGRLLAFVESRLHRRDAAEDVVQETLIGFLNSLPNYDSSRSLEGYLFSIAAHKLTDYLRREGRRPALPLSAGDSSSSGESNLPGKDRSASAIFRSGERRDLEAQALAAALADQIDRWRGKNEWWKIQCAELLFVRGWANKDVAGELNISEQQVANQKFDLLARLRTLLERQNLSPDVFPELAHLEN